MKKSGIEEYVNIAVTIIAVVVAWGLFSISLSGYGSEGITYSYIFLFIACLAASYFISRTSDNKKRREKQGPQ